MLASRHRWSMSGRLAAAVLAIGLLASACSSGSTSTTSAAASSVVSAASSKVGSAASSMLSSPTASGSADKSQLSTVTRNDGATMVKYGA